MNNFIYSIPTTVYFGKGQIEHLGEAVKEWGSTALVLYGGGSIKKNGIYDEAMRYLNEAGITVYELGGVEPNPRITTVRKGVEICREKGVQVIVPIGGGSTIDCAKAIAGAVAYPGDAWDIVTDPSKITDVVPIVSVLTLSATGSEMDCGGVISNMETNDKLHTANPEMRPKASILDPSYTQTVSAYQTGAGTSDIISHILEVYFTTTPGYMQDRMCEALLKTCIHYGVRAIAQPDDYEARANLMWASSWAINDFLAYGRGMAWSVHPMEHELSAYYDITHGAGLAILTPHWMRYVLSDATVDKFAEYGINVWGIDASLDRYAIANEAIARTADYFKQLGMPSTLKDVGIGPEKLEIMAEKAARSLAGAYVPLSSSQVLEILKAAL